jgi:HK97 family phage major capsid protein
MAGDKEDVCGFNGDGTSTYGGIRGLTKLIVDGGHGASKVTAASGHDLLSEIDATDIAATIAALPTYALPGAAWYLSNYAFATCFCKLAVSSGGIVSMNINGVMQPTYLGWPIRLSSCLPQVSSTLSGVVMLLFGDLSLSSTIGDRTGVEVKTSTTRLMDTDQILYRGRERFDLVNHDVGDGTTGGPIVGLVGN